MGSDDNDVDCAAVLDKVYAYIDHELDKGTLTYEKIKAHIEECRPCLSNYDIERVIKEVLARSCGEHAPDELRIRIQARIREVRLQTY